MIVTFTTQVSGEPGPAQAWQARLNVLAESSGGAAPERFVAEEYKVSPPDGGGFGGVACFDGPYDLAHLLHVAVAGVDRADGALVYEVSVRPSLPQASHTARTR